MAMSSSNSPRLTGGTSAHPGCAALAADTACKISSFSDRGTRDNNVPSPGFSLSKNFPEIAARSSPPIQFRISVGMDKSFNSPPLPRGPTAINHHICSGHVRRSIRHKKNNCTVVFIRFGHPAEWHPPGIVFKKLFVLIVENSGESQSIHTHLSAGPIGRQVTSQVQ